MRLEIPGIPKALKRHRTSKGKTYDPSKEDKNAFAWDVKLLSKGTQMYQESIKLELEYHMPIPKSYSKTKASKALGKPHTKKPDITNLAKFTEDALNKVLWEDDALIAEISAKKIYSEEPKTVITVEKIK